MATDDPVGESLRLGCEVVRPWTEELYDIIAVEAEDAFADGEDVVFYGEDEKARDWRVRLVKPKENVTT
jgi:hypothetical protein